MASKLNMMNRAIGLIRGKKIQSENERSLEAENCRAEWPLIIQSMLEGPHYWSWAQVRSTLAPLVNDRSTEWLYAYGLPADMASPVYLLPDLNGLGLGLPTPLPGNPYFEVWSYLYQNLAAPYIIEGDVLYTNAEAASLAYITTAVDAGRYPAKVQEAIILELASRIAMPVKGNSELRQQYRQEAEIAWDRAMADDENRQPNRQPPYTSEAELAREGR